MKSEEREIVKDSECGTEHADCINTIKGRCDRDGSHPGESHHCSSCNMAF